MSSPGGDLRVTPPYRFSASLRGSAAHHSIRNNARAPLVWHSPCAEWGVKQQERRDTVVAHLSLGVLTTLVRKWPMRSEEQSTGSSPLATVAQQILSHPLTPLLESLPVAREGRAP